MGLQARPDLPQNAIRLGERPIGYPNMGGQNPLIRTQLPHMKMMQVAAGHNVLHIASKRFEIKPGGRSFEQDARRVPQEPPTAEQHQDDDEDRDERVQIRPVFPGGEQGRNDDGYDDTVS